MKIGFIGLGKMGSAMVERLLEKEHDVVAFSRKQNVALNISKKGAIGVTTYKELIKNLSSPRIIWLMIPHTAVGEVLNEIAPKLREGDIVIDGGNSYYKHSQERAEKLKNRGISYLDIGVSGGIDGARKGACMMVGGTKITYHKLELLFHDMCTKNGYTHCGKSGMGHFVKMVHNGIEYGIMQAYAEGFSLLEKKKLNLPSIANVWNHGSIVASYLLKKNEEALRSGIESIKGEVMDSGEGRWCVMSGIEQGVSLPVITASLLERLSSQQKELFANKLLAKVRHEFGGHKVIKK